MKTKTHTKGYALFMLLAALAIGSYTIQTAYAMKEHPVIAFRAVEVAASDDSDYGDDYDDFNYEDDYGCEGFMSANEHAFYTAMRKLWNDHGVWTHDWIVAFAAGLPNADLVAARLLQNQDDIGNAVAAYYGKEAGGQLTALLKEHILIAVDLVKAAKAGNNETAAAADKKWHDNAKEIAAFLSKANPNWSEQALVDMLNMHLSLTAQQATAQLKQQWENSITLYDEIRKQLDGMADDLAKGIILQFPEKFDESI